jgi:hypothetical protein
VIAARLRAVLLEPGSVSGAAWRHGAWSPLAVCALAFVLALGSVAVAPLTGAAPSSTPLMLTPEARESLAAAGAVEALGRERFDRMASDVGALAMHVARAVVRLTPLLMAVLVPVLALCTRGAWGARGWPVRRHLALALDVNTAWFVAVAASLGAAVLPFTFLATVVSLTGIGYSTWYCAAAWRASFGDLPGGVWRSTLAALGYAVALVCGAYAGIVYAVMTY